MLAGSVLTPYLALRVGIFEEDKSHSEEITHAQWKRRPFHDRLIGRAAGLLRAQM